MTRKSAPGSPPPPFSLRARRLPDSHATRPRRNLWLILTAVAVGLFCVAGAAVGWAFSAGPPESSPPGPAPTARTDDRSTGRTVTAAEVIAQLDVKGRAPRTGFDRKQFGQAWADVDRNGCDTRNDMLRRDLIGAVIKEGTQGCRVESGVLHDPYSGERVAFVRGDGNLEVDHVVSLSDAWQKGAQQWTLEQRVRFANDPLNLVVTTRAQNQQKGPADAASWLPPNKAYRCSYVAQQAAVKQRYAAWITAAERDAMVRVLADCPSQPVPDG